MSCAVAVVAAIAAAVVVVGVNAASHPQAPSRSSAAELPGGQRTASATRAPAATAATAPTATAAISAAGAAATPAAAAARPLRRSAPVRVEIPAIGVDSTLVSLGLQSDGTLQVPSAGFPAGWYTGAPTPGERGPAIVVGHIDWGGRAGVFYRLHELKPGDHISITRADHSIATFRVTVVRQFPKDQFPTALVYGNLTYAGLRLITCGGAFDARAGSYRDDTVVFAQLARASSG